MPRYQPINPLLRYLIRWTKKTAKTARIATILAALILVTAFGLKEHPSIRTKLSMPQLHSQLNTEVHFAFPDFEGITDRLEAIAGQMTNVFTHGGREND